MVKDHTLSTGYRAVWMIKGGMSQTQVAKDEGVGLATIRRWQNRDRQGKTMENHSGRGRKPAMSQVAKIVVAKTALRGKYISTYHSTRTLRN